MARAKRQPAPRDMALSLLVLLVPVILIAWFFTSDPPEDAAVPTVDWKPVLAQARDQAPYPVLAPASAPAGWRATRASWTPTGQPDPGGTPAVRNTWRLGFLTDQQVYVSIEQGDALAAEMVAQESRDGKADGTSTIEGATWDRLVTTDGRTRSLVQKSAKVTTIVSGDVGYDVLDAFTATLTSGS